MFGANHSLSFIEFLEAVAEGQERANAWPDGVRAAVDKKRRQELKGSGGGASSGALVAPPPLNVHWRPQADLCQVGSLWHLYNVHGNFERLEAHAEALLRRAGLWDEFGSTGWGQAGGEGHMFQRNAAAHRSDYAGQAQAAGLTGGAPAGGAAFSEDSATVGRRRRIAGVNGAQSSTSGIADEGNVPSSSSQSGEGSREISYAAFASSLSSRAVEALGGRELAKLVSRVRLAYRRDYHLFGQIDSLARAQRQSERNGDDATPFDGSLYFPPLAEHLASLHQGTHQGGRPQRLPSGSSGILPQGGSDPKHHGEWGLQASLQEEAAPRAASSSTRGSRGGTSRTQIADDGELDDDTVVLRVRDPLPEDTVH